MGSRENFPPFYVRRSRQIRDKKVLFFFLFWGWGLLFSHLPKQVQLKGVHFCHKKGCIKGPPFTFLSPKETHQRSFTSYKSLLKPTPQISEWIPFLR